MDIRESYDSAAAAYAPLVGDELLGKPLDRHLLSRFAEDVRERGEVADLGCGPGHIARYVSALGVSTLGIDLSPEMVVCARRLAPGVQFRVGDMRSLDLPAGSMAGVVSFYSLVHSGQTSPLRFCERLGVSCRTAVSPFSRFMWATRSFMLTTCSARGSRSTSGSMSRSW